MKSKLQFIFSLVFFFCFSLNSFSQGLNSISSPDGNFVIAAGNTGKIIYSTNSGTRWLITTAGASDFKSVFTLGNNVWIAGSNGNVFTSLISNLNLIPHSTGNTGNINSVFFVDASTGYACSADGKIYKSVNGGVNWSLQNSISQSLNSISFKDNANGVCVGNSGTVLETSNGGANWQIISSGTSRNLLKVKYFSAGYTIVGEYGTLLSKSTASSIIQINSKIITDIRGVSGTSFSDIHICGGGGFIRNNKNNSEGYTNFETNPELQNLVDIFYYDDTKGWAISSMNDCVIRTTNGGADWQNTGVVNVTFSWEKKMDDMPLTTHTSVIYQHPFSRETFFAPFLNKIYVSRNNGDNWSLLSTFTPNIPIVANSFSHNFYVSKLDTNIWIAAVQTRPRNSIIRSTDYGATWYTVKDSMVFGEFANPLAEDLSNPGTYYCAQDSSSFYKSSDNGASFQKISSQAFNIPCDVLSIRDTNLIFVANANYASLTDSASILKSTNGGVNWSVAKKFRSPEIPYLAASQFNKNIIYASINSIKVAVSSDFGNSWETNLTATNGPWSLDVCHEDPTFIAYAKNTLTGYFSTNSGQTFTGVNFIAGISMNSNINPQRGLILAHFNKTVYKLKVSYDVTIDVRNITTVIPDKFSLSQNYPNPFNPNTNIKFQLPKSSFVSLKVFDALGREVKNLVNEYLSTGEYEVNFNGSDLNSGIYFYKLETENFTETRKMILVK